VSTSRFGHEVQPGSDKMSRPSLVIRNVRVLRSLRPAARPARGHRALPPGCERRDQQGIAHDWGAARFHAIRTSMRVPFVPARGDAELTHCADSFMQRVLLPGVGSTRGTSLAPMRCNRSVDETLRGSRLFDVERVEAVAREDYSAPEDRHRRLGNADGVAQWPATEGLSRSCKCGNFC
jgi:hypothetical protein